MLVQDESLRVGVPDVEVGVVHQVDGPLALRCQGYADALGAAGQGDGDAGGRGDGGQQQPHGVAGPGEALGAQRGARLRAHLQLAWHG
ncbi:hypothetical protein SMD44_08462 [Streptomyces alboflavus]|uniref:Uncharacterized protein n=1 Tax=Streptomyces alboflavus TaxID=67267 RepID=A0A1Z1WRB9_9ACTN|nr:hypothetical protein [Streptomyces alboflavus]ARX88975.1 hypothetical protein SMD44_08462 [Streptomyces alboflavus]